MPHFGKVNTGPETGNLPECEIAGLDELYFIDPAWACRTISEIVLSSKVKNHIEESGFITSEDRFQNLVR